MSEKKVKQNQNSKETSHNIREEKILQYWNENEIFKKSLEKEAPKGSFTFYDGPPFANGLPHYGHILAGTMKDVIPRFRTMQGYRVRRRWGWDCHGLPVENMVEKELGLKSKKDIVDFGVGKFNDAARESVMRYANEWRTIVPRLGRWVDMDNDYRTMDATYTETVWWIFKSLHGKGLIYEGFKAMNLCPRCETTLSNFEVAQGYKDITDISVYVKFEILNSKLQTNSKLKIKNPKEKTYFLAWTTTPWTLPGNVALAVGNDIDYVKVSALVTSALGTSKSQNENYILAKSRLSVLKDLKYEVVDEFKGSQLVGSSYEPLFDYYSSDKNLKNKESGWKIYGADFVTTEDGTGIVHIAPAFGADDYTLLQKYNLPFVQHVTLDGHFKPEVKDFAGQSVKPKPTDENKDLHQKADVEIIKFLAKKDSLFAKEKIVHSYPHCWRCDTPLLNYATSSWFVKVTDIKDKLVAANKKVDWVPNEIGEGRFGNWLEGARDWAISRSRFWGAPIPVWREERKKEDGNKEEYHVLGSVEDLKKFSKSKNTYYVMRHGQAENNVENILSCHIDNPHNLTDLGREQVKAGAESLKNKKINLIISSDFIRTKQTAELASDIIGLKKENIIYDSRIREFNSGDFNLKNIDEYHKYIGSFLDGFKKAPPNGENYSQVKGRMGDFIYDIDRKYQNKKILIISHETPLWCLQSVASGLDPVKSIALQGKHDGYMKNGQINQLDFSPLPHNVNYELDLHRPFIDEVELKTEKGNRLVRVQDVFDCWFESGSMPYAENHYPFENLETFNPKNSLINKSVAFPADFIAEGVDQTRGWFYSMIVLGVALFGKSPYKKVLVNGLVLAEDGNKMAKSKNNYPDPVKLVETYGADSLRYYLMSSPVVRGQDLRFSEKGVDEVTKKIVNRLLNVVTFYEMYSENFKSEILNPTPSLASDRAKQILNPTSQNIIDKWIVSRLNEVIRDITAGLEAGELDRASRPITDFVDDLSTWYLRRSRDRFKSDAEADKNSALETTHFVLINFAKVIAPFMPFIAEDIYRKVSSSLGTSALGTSSPNLSVHLEVWPTAGEIDTTLLEAMSLVRKISSQGLEARMKAGINVRQPLAMLKIKSQISELKSAAASELLELIKDEVNIKVVAFGSLIKTEVELDTFLTPQLKEEGAVRELIRMIQDLRKEKGLTVSDRPTLSIETDEVGKKFIEKNKATISAATLLKNIGFGMVGGEANKIGEFEVKLKISK